MEARRQARLIEEMGAIELDLSEVQSVFEFTYGKTIGLYLYFKANQEQRHFNNEVDIDNVIDQWYSNEISSWTSSNRSKEGRPYGY